MRTATKETTEAKEATGATEALICRCLSLLFVGFRCLLFLPLLAFACLCLSVLSCAADSAGTTVMNFLRLDVGARQTGMGGVGVGLFEDLQNMAYNPALGGMLRHNEIALTHANWLVDVKYQDFSAALATESMGTFGLRYKNLGYGKIESYDAMDNAMDSFKAKDTMIAMNWGKEIKRSLGFCVGVAAKYAKQDLSFASADAFMGDIGFSLLPFKEHFEGAFSFGAALKNVGPSVTFDREKESLPQTLDFGFGWKGMVERLSVGLDAHFPKGQSKYYNAGAQYWVADMLALRAGFETNQDEGLGPGGLGIRLGGGIRFGDWQFDYAWLPFGALGNTHHIGILLKFGGPAEAAYRSGIKAMRKAKYAEAIVHFYKALKLDPKMEKAGLRLKQAHEKLQEFKETP